MSEISPSTAKLSSTFAYFAFTDGACSGNPGPGGWAYVGYDLESAFIQEAGAYVTPSTNNRMELQATIEAIKWALSRKAQKDLVIFSDSKLVLQGITLWIHAWKKRDWKKSDGTDVVNPDLWQELHQKVLNYPGKIHWRYVAGHSGILGNERVDEIAVGFAKREPVELFKGSFADYHLPEIFNEHTLRELMASGLELKRSSKEKLAKEHKPYYLSFLEGKLLKHSTWGECEARVKGKAGAKFKKISSAAEESATLKKWEA